MEKKITMLLVALYPSGACPIFTYELAKGLIHNNVNVEVVLPYDVVNKVAWINLLSANKIFFVHNEKSNNKILFKLQKFTNIIKFFLIGRYQMKNLKTKNYDYIMFTFYHRWNYLIRNITNYQKTIMIVHDPVLHSDDGKRAKNHFKQVKSMDKVIILSKKFHDIMKHDYGFNEKDIIYIPHGLMEYGKRSTFIPSDRINFIFFGRINEYKGLDYLIDAYKKISERYDNTSLTIAGKGNINKLESLMGIAHIKIINRYIKDAEIPEIFNKKNSVIVLPYTDATQSGVIAIAYYYGIPVIASNTGGLVEQLNNGKLGIFVNPADSDDLYMKMEYVINNPQILETQGKEMKMYGKLLSWDHITADLLRQLGC